MRRLAAWFLLCALATLGGLVQAADYAEISARVASANKGFEEARQVIAQAQSKLQKAIDKTMQAEHFEGPHWAELEQAMKDWSKTVEKQAAVIDGHARTLLKLAPTVSVPVVELDPPAFKPLLKQMEGIARDLQAKIDRAEAMKRRYQQLEAQVQSDIGEAAKGKVADIVVDAIGVPTDAADLVATLAAGPIGTVYGAAKTAWGLYYYLDEMKSAGRVLKTAREQVAFADEFIQKTQANLASARQGIGFLERYMVQREETLAKFYRVRSGWLRVAEEAAGVRSREQIRQFDEALAKPEPDLQLARVWPSEKPLMLPASEYESEAEAILRELRSAAAAAVDGGSPLAFHDLLDGHIQRLAERRRLAQEVVYRASQTYQAAYSAYVAAVWAARDSLNRAWRHCDGLPDYNSRNACAGSAEASFKAAVNAAIASVHGPARALMDASREEVRLRQIAWVLGRGADELQSMMRETASARRLSYGLRWGEHLAARADAWHDANAALSGIPDPWRLSDLAATADGLPERIVHEIRFGTDPAALRDRLRDEARQIRMQGEVVRQAAREYRKRLEAQRNVANRAESELGAFVARYGPLLRYHEGSPDYTQAAIDAYIERELNSIQWIFKVEEAGYVAEAERFDYAGTARRIEAGIAELDDWVQRLDTFRWRLGAAQARLDQASRAITGMPAYAPRPRPLSQQAEEELRGGSWSALVADLERLRADAELRAALNERYRGLAYPPALEGGPPRRLLLSVQTGLHALAQAKMRDYLNTKRWGGFHVVDEAAMNRLTRLWQALEPLYARFEALAAGERARVEALYALLPDDSRLTQAYQALPKVLTGLAQGAYNRYVTEAGALRGYLQIKREALQPVGGEIAAELKDWITGYPVAKADWERREAEAEARRQAELQRIEAEERARRERKEAERQAAEAHLRAVRQLYQDFAEAYQARNLARLTRMMSPDWQASDGSDLTDLEDNLGNSFRVFDRVQFRVDNLSIQPQGHGLFRVTYSVTISGQIFQMDMKHQETSNIEDLVQVGADGTARIRSTRGGQFWLQ